MSDRPVSSLRGLFSCVGCPFVFCHASSRGGNVQMCIYVYCVSTRSFSAGILIVIFITVLGASLISSLFGFVDAYRATYPFVSFLHIIVFLLYPALCRFS